MLHIQVLWVTKYQHLQQSDHYIAKCLIYCQQGYKDFQIYVNRIETFLSSPYLST